MKKILFIILIALSGSTYAQNQGNILQNLAVAATLGIPAVPNFLSNPVMTNPARAYIAYSIADNTFGVYTGSTWQRYMRVTGDTMTAPLVVQSASGISISAYRVGSTPGTGASFLLYANDAAGTKTLIGNISATISSNTAGATTSSLTLGNIVSGAQNTALTFAGTTYTFNSFITAGGFKTAANSASLALLSNGSTFNIGTKVDTSALSAGYYTKTQSDARYSLLNLTTTSTIDFGSVPANGELAAPSTITLTGAVVGDVVCPPQAASNTAGINYKAFVTSANTVTVYAINYTTAPIDPASLSFKFVIVR